jgi:putative heme-binding domain-containing protein
MVLPRDEASLKAILASNGTEDSDAQVRLAALLALSELPASPDSARAVFASLNAKQNAKDRWIPDAATAAAARNDAGFLQVVLASYKPVTSSTKEAAPANVLTNPSFEVQTDGQATGWHPVTHSGRGDFGMGDSGHTGSKSAKISSENGADVSWTATVSVKPRTDYKLTGWIKTQGVGKRGGAKGALFNIHELQDPVNGATKGLAGDNDWTQVQLNFNSGEMTEVTVNCLFGGWGQATGTAWFDDVELVPAPGSELAGETGRVLRVVTAHYAQRGPLDTIVATLTSLKGASPGVATAVLDGLVSGWPEDKTPTLSETDKSTLTGLMNSMAESSRDRLLALAQKWGQPEIFGANFVAIIEGLKKQISDGNAADDLRAAAAKRLMTLEARLANAELIVGQIGLLTPPALGTGLLGALTDSRDRDTGKAVVNGWQQYTPTLRRTAIGVLMRRPDWTRTLLDAIEKGTIARTDLATEQWSQLKQNPNRELGGRATRLSATGPAISADREEIVKKLLPLAKEHGNPTRGKEVFTANCSACHTFNGQGGKVGPDLSGIGAKDRSEILTDILDPNRSVEANYRLWSLTTKDGETFSGRLDTETQTSVEILDTTGQKHAIQRSKIATLESSQNSIMPNGFESIPADDIKGLLDYLGPAHL